jgi:hypothetical protein
MPMINLRSEMFGFPLLALRYLSMVPRKFFQVISLRRYRSTAPFGISFDTRCGREELFESSRIIPKNGTIFGWSSVFQTATSLNRFYSFVNQSLHWNIQHITRFIVLISIDGVSLTLLTTTRGRTRKPRGDLTHRPLHTDPNAPSPSHWSSRGSM